eukprot:2947878-Lingulodinium_polyedra.AAC.1
MLGHQPSDPWSMDKLSCLEEGGRGWLGKGRCQGCTGSGRRRPCGASWAFGLAGEAPGSGRLRPTPSRPPSGQHPGRAGGRWRGGGRACPLAGGFRGFSW